MSSKTPTLTKFLAWLYGEEALLKSSYSTIYPVAVKLCTLTNPEDVLVDLTEDTRQFPATSWLLEEMKQQNQHLWNGKTYVFLGLDSTSTDPRLHCAEGYYFDTVNTCIVLEEELKRNLAKATESDFASLYATMHLRRAIHQNQIGKAALADAWSGERRSAAIAICCLFVASDGVSYRYYVRRRSANLADGAGLYHVIPSMVFQPIAKDGNEPDSFSITNTILREVAEELFDHEEEVTPEHETNCPPEIMALRELLQTGGAELLITGVAMELLSLRPEILAVLIVHDPEWLQQYESHIRFSSSEYANDTEDTKSDRDLDDETVLEPGGEFAPENCVVAGAACLIVGLPVARQLRDRYSHQASHL